MDGSTEAPQTASQQPGSPRLRQFIERYRPRVERALDDALPAEDVPPSTLHRAMRYSALAAGKRVRPLLVLAAVEACGADPEPALPAACAVELIHAYSLIHDDLPAFDDDDVRRGQPTSHVVYGEPVAILAGDALQTLAFEQLARAAVDAADPELWTRAAAELATAAGSKGMAGGQCLDLEALGSDAGVRELAELHAAKTGALLAACLRIGGTLARADDPTLEALGAYGRDIGLAFQIIDDVLDVEGSVETLGKVPGGDASRGQPSYSGLLGVEGARQEAQRLRDLAVESLEPLPRPQLLEDFAHLIVDRQR